MKNYIIFLALICFSTITYAQSKSKDYLVKITGDTIFTKVKYNLMGKVVYKLPDDPTSYRIDTSNVGEYFCSKQKPFNFVAVHLPDLGKKTFVGILEKGKITLYVRTVHSSKSSTNYWYADKNGQVLEINNEKRLFGVDNKLKNNLQLLIADNDQIASEFQAYKKYNIKVIRAIIQKYNAASI